MSLSSFAHLHHVLNCMKCPMFHHVMNLMLTTTPSSKTNLCWAIREKLSFTRKSKDEKPWEANKPHSYTQVGSTSLLLLSNLLHHLASNCTLCCLLHPNIPAWSQRCQQPRPLYKPHLKTCLVHSDTRWLLPWRNCLSSPACRVEWWHCWTCFSVKYGLLCLSLSTALSVCEERKDIIVSHRSKTVKFSRRFMIKKMGFTNNVCP